MGDINKNKWFGRSVTSQLANISSDIGRSFQWKGKNMALANKCMYMALDYFDATLADPKNKKRRREILIAKELYADVYFERGEYNETEEGLMKYFNQ